MKAIIALLIINTLILICVIYYSESRVRSTVRAEVQKLTPVISEGRAYFSGVCVEPLEVGK